MVATLDEDLELRSDELLNAIDLAVLADERLAVLDRDGAVLFSPAGVPLGRWGRRGVAPGEFVAPFGIVPVGEKVVVAQGTTEPGAITVFDRHGTVLSAVGPPIDGDWLAYRLRGPALFADHPVGSGVEDWSRRIQPASDTTYYLAIQDQERGVSAEDRTSVKGPLHIIHLSVAGTVLDTLTSLPASPSILWSLGNEERPGLYWEPLFQGRPLWAAGLGWWATSHFGDSAVIVHVAGRGSVRLEWPAARRSVTEDDRDNASRYAVDYARRASTQVPSRIPFMSPSERARLPGRFKRFFQFAVERPEITGLWAAGDCILVVPFDSRTYIDGAAGVMARVHVKRAAMLDVVRIGTTDVRVLAVTDRYIYGRTYDDEDVPSVRRWRLPDGQCQPKL